MVKCVVSGCPNRVVNRNRGIFNRPPKRFFDFPKDPARVKVWLAALRETNKEDSAEQHLICEDHFLPEDLSPDGVAGDAIPIMPPCLDGALSLIGRWRSESSEEEDQWGVAAADEDDDDDNDEGGDDVPAVAKPPAPQQLPVSQPSAPQLPEEQPPPSDSPKDPQLKTENIISDGLPQWRETNRSRHGRPSAAADVNSPDWAPTVRLGYQREKPVVEASQQCEDRLRSGKAEETSTDSAEPWPDLDVSLGVLTRRFLELFMASPDGSLDLRHVTANLETRRRRVYDITNTLEGISLIEKQSASRVRWIGNCPISSYVYTGEQRVQKELKELENLKLVEDTLDSLIKSCAQQLFEMTDDQENSASAYVTHEDIRRLSVFQDQTIIIIKAPEETKLEVPPPTEENIQIHLKGGQAPIVVLTSDIGEDSDCFMTLKQSRINTSTMCTESSGPQNSLQTA